MSAPFIKYEERGILAAGHGAVRLATLSDPKVQRVYCSDEITSKAILLRC